MPWDNLLKLRKTRQTPYLQFPRDSATMLEKIKSENFLGSQIVYLHVPFRAWKNITVQWKKWHTQNQLELELMTFRRRIDLLNKYLYGALLRAWHCSMGFMNIPTFNIHRYPHKAGAILISILQMGKMRHQAVRSLAFSNPVSLATECDASIITPCFVSTADLMSNMNQVIHFGGNGDLQFYLKYLNPSHPCLAPFP